MYLEFDYELQKSTLMAWTPQDLVILITFARLHLIKILLNTFYNIFLQMLLYLILTIIL